MLSTLEQIMTWLLYKKSIIVFGIADPKLDLAHILLLCAMIQTLKLFFTMQL